MAKNQWLCNNCEYFVPEGEKCKRCDQDERGARIAELERERDSLKSQGGPSMGESKHSTDQFHNSEGI